MEWAGHRSVGLDVLCEDCWDGKHVLECDEDDEEFRTGRSADADR